ncbi:MAG: hypothetical protein JSW70_02060 [Syntrophobacterales bacterium]|nr:MAG: hypothetical protein JSW70_02060 [Syntrophobacterales bacterium]
MRGHETSLVNDYPYLANERNRPANQEVVTEHDGTIAYMYLKEMGKIPLLTREGEIKLAKQIHGGQREIRVLLGHCLVAAREIDHLGQELGKDRCKVSRFGEEVTGEVISQLGILAKHHGDHLCKLRDLLEELKKAEANLKKAEVEIVQGNLRLVVKTARDYNKKGLSFVDLLQEGNLGLIRGVERYDYRRGFRFSTYAIR